MGKTEIERKFLVHGGLLPRLESGHKFRQGYLCDAPTTRVRVADHSAWITIKGPGRMSRREFEYEVPVEDALEILAMCQHSLEKTRFLVREGGHVWEVDHFHGRLDGLWLAEVELSSETEEFERPKWLGREVTMEPGFSNSSLARGGVPRPDQ